MPKHHRRVTCRPIAPARALDQRDTNSTPCHCVGRGARHIARGGRTTALDRVTGGRVIEAELETESGRRVWSFDIRQPDSKNIVEVQVDATDGRVVSTKTETPKDEAKEKAAEKKK